MTVSSSTFHGVWFRGCLSIPYPRPVHTSSNENRAPGARCGAVTVRLGILSDTHNELERTHRAVQRLRAEGAEALIHCGDLSSPAIVALLAGLPSWFVLGNHDA